MREKDCFQSLCPEQSSKQNIFVNIHLTIKIFLISLKGHKKDLQKDLLRG